MLFEGTALSKNSAEVVRRELATLREGRMTPDFVFRDPYLFLVGWRRDPRRISSWWASGIWE